MYKKWQVSKAGLERFTETLAQEVAPLKIRTTRVRAGKMHDSGLPLTMSLQGKVIADRLWAEPASDADL